jgi:HEAT repeat protein
MSIALYMRRVLAFCFLLAAVVLGLGLWFYRYAPAVAPAVKQVAVRNDREVSLRARSVDNLQRLVVAMHKYEDAHQHFPPPAILDKAGRPLLSWRVLLLPYLGEKELFTQFKLDEPWDGPNNNKLLARMPPVFAPVRDDLSGTHETFYQVFVGPGTPFGPSSRKGPRLVEFFNGTSNTILIVEAGGAVPWTSPQDLSFDAAKALPKRGGMFTQGYHVAFADGDVQFVANAGIDEKLVRGLITLRGEGQFTRADLDAALAKIDHPLLYGRRPLGHWVKELRSDDPKRREAARQVLAYAGPAAKAAIPLLLDQIRSDPGAHASALTTLVDIRPPTETLVPVLLDALAVRKDARVWLAARPALLKLGPGAIPGLVKSLKHESYLARRRADQILRAMPESVLKKHPEATRALQERKEFVFSSSEPAGCAESLASLPGLLEALERPEEDLIPELGPSLISGPDDVAFRLAFRFARPFVDLGPPLKATVPFLLEAAQYGKESQFLNPKASSGRFREHYLEAVGRLGSQAREAIPDLIRLLEDNNLGWRAALALGDIGPAAVPLLQESVQHSRGFTRARAIFALGEIGPRTKAAIPLLLAIARDDKDPEQTDAALALSYLGPDARAVLPILVGMMKTSKLPAAKAILRLDGANPEAARALVDNLQKGDWKAKVWLALEVLEIARKNADAFRVLRESLKMNDLDHGRTAQALGRLGPAAREVFPDLVGILRDSTFGYPSIATAIARIDPEAAGPVLAEILQKSLGAKPGPRRDALEALQEIGPKAGPAVAGLLKSLVGQLQRKKAADENRGQAAWVLGGLGALAAPCVPDLLAVLNDEDMSLRREAVRALARIDPKGAVVRKALAYVLESGEASLRRQAVLALGEGGAENVPVVAGVLQDRNPYVRGAAVAALGCLGPKAVPALTTALEDPDADVRRLTVLGLMKVGLTVPDVIPALAVASADKDREVRRMAAYFLAGSGVKTKTVVTALLRSLKDCDAQVRKAAVVALGEIGPAAGQAVPTLAEALRDGEPYVRWRAAYALGQIGSEARSAWPALVEFWKSAKGPDHDTAGRALERIDAAKAAKAGVQ